MAILHSYLSLPGMSTLEASPPPPPAALPSDIAGGLLHLDLPGPSPHLLETKSSVQQPIRYLQVRIYIRCI